MAQLSSLLTRISPMLASKASVPLMLQKLQDTVVDFYDRTNIFVRTLAPIDVVAPTAEYVLTAPANYVIVEVLTAWLDGKRLNAFSEQELDLNWVENDAFRCGSHGSQVNDWRQVSTPRPGGFLMSNETGNLVLAPIPETDYPAGLVVRAAWKPLATVSTIDDVIYNDHYMTLVEGAVGRLQQVPSKPWTDIKAAAIHMGIYDVGVEDAAAEIRRNNRRSDRIAYRTKAYV